MEKTFEGEALMVPQQRTLRIVQIMFVVYAALLFWLMHTIKPTQLPGPLKPIHEAIAAIAVADCLIGIAMRRMFLAGSMRRPHNSAAVDPVKRWFLANVIGFAFAMSTCLFGFVEHMLGAPERLAQALVGLGIAVMIGLMPGQPPSEQSGISPYGNIE
jgi:hypothetical protein